ncbi:MAG: amidohydrolase family protein [Peptococcaceae bacterium]|nr:amidohydrolase family protein [Peptococcaceae bacterium]
MSSPRLLIDSHVHLMTPPRIRGGIKWIRKAVPAYNQLSLEVTCEEIIGHLKQAGVDYIINYFYPLGPGESREINRWQHRLGSEHGFVVPFASLHPGDRDKKGLISEAYDGLDLAGFKFHPYVQQFYILDRDMAPVYSELEKRGRPVTFHTGFAAFYGLPPVTGSFLELLRRYPGMKVIAAHMLFADFPIAGWPELLEKHPGLYLDATNTLSLLPPGSGEEALLKDLVGKYSHRMVFGTDYPMGMDFPVENLFKLAHQICPDRESLENLSWRTMVNIVGKERFKNLPLSETEQHKRKNSHD